MANNVGELINEIFGLVGIDATQPQYKDMVGLTTPVPPDVAEKISKNILSLETAKMNGQLKAHFKAQTLNGVDAQHDELATEYGLTADQTAELKAIKDTFERNKKLVAKVKENTAKLNEGKGDTAKLVEENKKLNDQILANKTAFDKQLSDMQNSKEAELNDYAIMSHLRSLKYANDKVDAEVNALTAKNIIQSALASKKIGVKRDNNSLRLFQLENPELDYLDNHKPISFADLASRELQAKNMLAVSDPQRATGKNGKAAAPAAGGKDDPAPDNSEAISFYDQQLAQFEQG